MLEAAFWGLVTAGSLWVGAALALLRPSTRLVGLAMGFGSGALIAAVAYELVLDAFETSVELAAFGFAVGALVFYAGSWAIDRRGEPPTENGRGKRARRERERDRARHGSRRRPRVVRPGSVDLAGRRRARPSSSGCSPRTYPRRSRAASACWRPGGRAARVFRMWSVVVAVSVLGRDRGWGLLDSCRPAAAPSRRRSPPARCS